MLVHALPMCTSGGCVTSSPCVDTSPGSMRSPAHAQMTLSHLCQMSQIVMTRYHYRSDSMDAVRACHVCALRLITVAPVIRSPGAAAGVRLHAGGGPGPHPTQVITWTRATVHGLAESPSWAACCARGAGPSTCWGPPLGYRLAGHASRAPRSTPRAGSTGRWRGLSADGQPCQRTRGGCAIEGRRTVDGDRSRLRVRGSRGFAQRAGLPASAASDVQHHIERCAAPQRSATGDARTREAEATLGARRDETHRVQRRDRAQRRPRAALSTGSGPLRIGWREGPSVCAPCGTAPADHRLLLARRVERTHSVAGRNRVVLGPEPTRVRATLGARSSGSTR